ncbi:MAG: lytic murein transglycosylase [Ancrocorticia sp.]
MIPGVQNREEAAVMYTAGKRRHGQMGGVLQGVRAVANQDDDEDTTAKLGTLGRLGINTAARAGAPRPMKRVTTRSGRHQARGVRRFTNRAVQTVQAVSRRVVSAVAMKLGVASGGVVLAVAAVLVVLLAILSFLPSWMTNFFIKDETTSLIFPMGDDYPWASQVRDVTGNPTDLFNTPNPETNYYFGNCTDFVFWRVNRDMGGGPGHWIYTHSDLTPHGGNGKEWGMPGNLPGWTKITRLEDAGPGDVVSFQPGTFGHTHWAGHVAMVANVTEAGLVTENYGNADYYVETIPRSQVQAFLASGDLVIKRNPALAERAEAMWTSGGVSDAVPPKYRSIVTRAGSICPEISSSIIAAQVEAESNWNERAGSPAGAQGIAQFMPATWATAGRDGDGDGRADIYNPDDAIISQAYLMCGNVAAAATLKAQGRASGDVVDLALAGYNAGMGAVQLFGGIPPYPETQAYVPKIRTLAATKYAATGRGGTGSRAASGAVQWAQTIIGMPYGRGQGNGSVDCCWMVYLAFRNGAGVELPMEAPQNPPSMSKCEYAMYGGAASYGGRYVPATVESLRPGDILFWQDLEVDPAYDNITHVGIYVGNGQFIDSIPAGGVGIRNLSYYRNTQQLLPQAVRLAA